MLIKKINSIWFGARVLAAAGIFLVVLPLVLYVIHLAEKYTVLNLLIKISFVIGAIIIIFFSIILAIELRQDKKINKQYNKVRYKKIQLSDGMYECQYCGNHKVTDDDLYCKVCGIKFLEEHKQ